MSSFFWDLSYVLGGIWGVDLCLYAQGTLRSLMGDATLG